ncbi:MAG: hypothetical protein HDT15_11235 [Oscillibacter sp.]|nr:hypothetical protein [Oscillibacter sp.]
MYIVEALLLTVLLLTCLYVSMTDIRNGVIENKILAGSAFLCFVLNIAYYIFFAKEYFGAFLIDFLLLVLLSIGMYALNLWAAGDSKLLFLVVFAIPGRFYNQGSGSAPAVYIVIFTFAIAFVYIVGESILLSIRRHEKPKLPSIKGIGAFLKNYISIAVYIVAVNYLVYLLFPIFAASNASLIAVTDLLLSVVIHKYPVFFKLPVLCTAAALSAGIVVLHGLRYGYSLPDLKVYGYIAIIVFLRSISEKYNYQIIPTASVKPGMILSLSAVLAMAPSRVAGLPRTTTEDMRSRLSPEEAAAVIRWENSKYGQHEISIVRKIPFAIFITLGALTFIIFRLGGI